MQSSYSKDTPTPLNDGLSSRSEFQGSQNTVDFSLSGFVVSSGFVAYSVTRAKHWRSKFTTDRQQVSRYSNHVTVVVVALLAIGLSQLQLPWGAIKAIHPIKQSTADPSPIAEIPTENALPLTLSSQIRISQNGLLVRAAVPRTIISERAQSEAAQSTTGLRTYIVESGDNISSIAAKFGLSSETIIWSNAVLENNPDILSIGQELTILPVDGIYHQVGGGDTVETVASTFKTSPDLIINHPLNSLSADNPVIQIGQWLIVPDGTKPFVPRAVRAYSGPVPTDASTGTGIFGWPASGEISQGYFGYHPGIDIAGWTGASVLAADSGYVVSAGWDNLLGYHVVIDHGNGFQTLYGHMQEYYVEPGMNVLKGEKIGEMGSTGNSTGPHLHFELRQGTVQRNPYGFLP